MREPSSPYEAALAGTSAGRVVAFFSYGDEAGIQVASAVLEPTADGYEQPAEAATIEGWGGPDQALASWGDRLAAAWIRPQSSPRQLALALLDPAGAPLGEPCLIRSARAVANDADVECGEGVCVAVWIEADAYESETYLTRLVQFPMVPGGLCR